MPQSSRKTRDRHLAKLAERRRRERTRRRRQRILAASVAIAVAVGGLGFAAYALILNNPTKPAASPTATPTPSVTPGGVACGASVPKAAEVEKKTYKKPPKVTIDAKKTYRATLKTSCGTIVFQLDRKLAPNTVNSFVFLAKQHFFDGLIFHRISREFVIQGGDPTGSGSGGPGYKTVDAPPKDSKYPVGVVAMAKSGDEAAGTSGSQFFIVIGKEAELPPDYAIIGKVIKGQDVAEKIGALPIEGGASDGRPAQTVYIEKVTIKAS
ncbi:MAG TPA: peptidylprolyl isomerase [Actinomycetota bacterium]|nr:peptidylprolyl isomerase [Actinomycetota bacterium]